MPSERVAVAMSGGVDSSVAAAILKQQGYDVFGVYLKLRPDEPEHLDLEQTCRILGIPLHKLDLTSAFEQTVLSYFCAEYQQGRTPNPCVVCNQRIKFGKLLDWAQHQGVKYLATGHYTRVVKTDGGYLLNRGVDKAKDQSYFLYRLGQAQLSQVLFPLGGITKIKVKAMAKSMKLPATERRESQDICFIFGDYRPFIRERVAPRAGDMVDINGSVLGRHEGLAFYTVGQRHGLGIAAGRQLYVLKLDAENNRVIVGDKDGLLSKGLVARGLSWVSGRVPEKLAGITVKVRYKAPEVSAKIEVQDGRAEVRFAEPQSAVTPGQSVVFYDGDIVLGGGVIDAVL